MMGQIIRVTVMTVMLRGCLALVIWAPRAKGGPTDR